MKPSWDKAPAGYEWLAMDRSGRWYWYTRKPEKVGSCWVCVEDGSMNEYEQEIDNWEDSLEQRPCSPPPSP